MATLSESTDALAARVAEAVKTTRSFLSGVASRTADLENPATIHVLHLNGPEYGVPDPTAATSTFSNANPGTYDVDFHYEKQASLDYFASRGWHQVKVPIRWERIQPTISGALDPTELGRLTDFLDRADNSGLKVIVDIHNYGVYYRDVSGTGTRTAIGSAQLPVSAFADLWSRLSTAIKDHPAVFGYAIMAEPQPAGGLDRETWQEASQAAVDAIRAVDLESEISVAGWDYSITQGWTQVNGDPWVYDHTGRVRYEGHHYWDSNTSGGYSSSYAQEVTTSDVSYDAGTNPDALYARVLTEMDEFNSWLTDHEVRGVLGEIGWPAAADSTEWNALADAYLTRATEYGIPTATWCAGDFAFGGTADLRVYTGNPVDTANPQAAVLEDYLDTSTPVALHAGTHATGGTDPVSPASIGAEAVANKAVANGYASLDGTGRVPVAQATIHAHDASVITQGNLDPLRLPQWIYTQTNVVYDDAVNHNMIVDVASFLYPAMFSVTMSGTGSATFTEPVVEPEQSIANAMNYKLHVYASGGTRSFSFASEFKLSTGITSRSFSIPSGKVLMAAVEYSTALGAWVIVAATVSS